MDSWSQIEFSWFSGMSSYRTGELAIMVGVHPNTVRLYERTGLIAPATRTAVGYRVFDEKHVCQLRIVRLVFGCAWVGRTIRQSSLQVMRAMADWHLAAAEDCARHYLGLLEQEIAIAEQTALILQHWTERGRSEAVEGLLSRKEAASAIGVTPEALRNWERNGLLKVPRQDPNQARCYGKRELERLRIIYMLRQAGYGLDAILRSLQRHDLGDVAAVAAALNDPQLDHELSWCGVGDRWLAALSQAMTGAREILQLIRQARSQNL